MWGGAFHRSDDFVAYAAVSQARGDMPRVHSKGGAPVVRRGTSVGESLIWTEGLPRSAIRSRSRRAAFLPISCPA